MMKTLAVAIAALTALPALAQNAPTTTTAPQNQRSEMAPRGDAMTSGFISAEDLVDEDVLNEANENVGEVEDVLIDREGRIAGVIISVGGFLGIGEKDVLVTFDKLKFAKDNDNDLVVTINATKESLEAAPAHPRDRS